MNPSAAIGIQSALTQQAIGLSVLKQSAQMDQELANILAQSSENVPVSSVRGGNVNITA